MEQEHNTMADEDTTPTVDPTSADSLLEEIRTAGEAGDSVTQTLAKGMADGFKSLLELVKAHRTHDPQPTGGEDTGHGGDDSTSNVTDDDDPDAGDGEEGTGGGYDDMMMGDKADGFGGTVTPEGTLDVTKFVKDTGKTLIGLAKGRKSDHDLLKKAVSQQSELLKAINKQNELLAAFIEGTVTTQAPLAKAVIDLRETVLNVPETVHTPKPRMRADVPANDAAFIGGNELAEKRALIKGRRDGIIDAGMRRRFHLERRFVEDETENAAIRAQLSGTAAS
jgi:hypothetical protein